MSKHPTATPKAPTKHDNTWCSHHPRSKPEHDLSPRLARNVKWYRRTRAWLIAELGGKCVECGATEQLEFDHLKPRTWRPEKTSRWQRLRNYIKDWKRGIAEGEPRIALRCRSCNGSKGYPDGQQELLEVREARREEEPF